MCFLPVTVNSVHPERKNEWANSLMVTGGACLNTSSNFAYLETSVFLHTENTLSAKKLAPSWFVEDEQMTMVLVGFEQRGVS